MESQRHCPHCKSFEINRKKRGFFRKVILRVPPLYQCNKCHKVFSTKEMAENKKTNEWKE